MTASSGELPLVGGLPNRRTDPDRDRRRLALYFGALFVVYVGAVVLAWPSGDAEPNELVFAAVMYAPLVGALLARYAGPGVIQWGTPSWWILGTLIPPAAVLGIYLVGASLGVGIESADLLGESLKGAAGAVLLASLLAFGEEVGWRGFLWPLLRTRYRFLMTSAVVGAIWWVYHVPFIFFGWYGSVAGVPAFTVALIGATLFIGVLTDRSRSLWPSVFVHAAWNALVATTFAVHIDGFDVPAFSGADHLLGEFGWIPAITILVVGVAFTWWHLRDQTALDHVDNRSERIPEHG